MQISYGRLADAMLIRLDDLPSIGGKDIVPGLIIMHVTEDGTAVNFELLHASRYVTDPEHADVLLLEAREKR